MAAVRQPSIRGMTSVSILYPGRFLTPEAKVTGKDLYMHVATDPEKRITYYLHLWSNSRTVKEKIIPLSPSMADRFLKVRGLNCNLFPKNDPVANLYAWGYGIAEEF